MTVPCYQCQERQIGCHAKCERYAEYRAKVDALNAKARRERPANGFTADHEIRNIKFRKRVGTQRNSGK